MIRLVFAFFLLLTTPALAGQSISYFEPAPAPPPTRKVPQEQPPPPVAIVPENRSYAALIRMLLNNRKPKTKWHPDSGRWHGKDGHKRKAHRHLRITKRSSVKW